MATNDRLEQFKADVADLKLKTGSAGRENLLIAPGVVFMVAGVAVALVAYQVSLNQDDPRDVQSSIVLAVAMLCVTAVGAVVFLRYSLARFLRLWLLRQLYEGQAHVDQAVEAVRSRDAGGPGAGA